MKARNLHQHRVWSSTWQIYREDFMRIWSRLNLEKSTPQWATHRTARGASGPKCIIVTGEVEYNDQRTRWTQTADVLLWEAVWRR